MNSTPLRAALWRRLLLRGLCTASSVLFPLVARAATPAFPPEQTTSIFVGANLDGTSPIVVDGLADVAYASAPVVAIANAKNGSGTADYALPTISASGTLRSVWDGHTLYVLVEVNDATPSDYTTGTGLPAWGLTTGATTVTAFDGVEFAIDFWNDKIDKFEDDDGLFTISRDGKLTFVTNFGVINHQSVHAYQSGREYTNRIKDFKVAATATGYAVELALQIDGAPLQNGTKVGLDVMIGDSPANNLARTARVYWSHKDNAYPASSQDHPVDWGIVTLAGWNGVAPFAFSSWRLTDQIRWAKSIRLPKGVWTPTTNEELQDALAEGEATVASVGSATDFGAQAAIDASATRLANAIKNLRWVDTKYPDPMDLPSVFHLPDPWTYFDGDPVESPQDWFKLGGRREEILDLAQFYEYGYKPAKPESFSLGNMTVTNTATTNSAIVPVTFTYQGKTTTINFTLFFPTPTQLANSGHADSPVPVLLGFGAVTAEYLNAGIAVMQIPTSVTSDDRNNPWGVNVTTGAPFPRTGSFRTFFPYSRDNDPNEISNEMGAAWGASRAIDVLEYLVANHVTLINAAGTVTLGDIAARVYSDKLAITGFSINGKYAFVSAVFDDRIDVCIPGAAGASGPSPYRYISMGHKYVTPGYPAESTGTEVMGDTIRHNPGRGTEFFRRFLEPFHFYMRKPGAWGYGDRLPYDHNDLVASLAPRALVLCHTMDDFGDDSEGDALSLSVAKIVYKWLGYDGDNLLKFNFRAFGGHGEDSSHRTRQAQYLNYYFYGTPMPEATATLLNTNPFLNDGVYDRYFGGLSTIAPWMHSRDIAMNVSVLPKSIPEGLTATLDVAVTGTNLKGRELTAYLMSGDVTIAQTPVASAPGDWNGVWVGSIYLAAAPAAGDYKIVVKIANSDAVAETPLTITTVAPIASSGASAGNKEADLRFTIDSANGKGYVLYLSTTGEPGSFGVWSNVNFNSKGVHIKGLENGKTYYVFVAYTENDYIVSKTSVTSVTLH